MKHPEPEIVKDYYAAIHKAKSTPGLTMPKVCHTCDNYADIGICTEFGDYPPEEFAKTPGQCELWLELIPF